jgi:hypothetical protein
VPAEVPASGDDLDIQFEAKALYAYLAEGDNEISLNEGAP